MTPIKRYAVTLPGAPGTQAPTEVVTVYLTAATGPDGWPVYADASGDFRVQITDDGVAQLLTAASGHGQMQCLHATVLP
ncbi:DUF6296 family protein [Kitasatospora sp. Ki12]